jgi:hypothetical protein
MVSQKKNKMIPASLYLPGREQSGEWHSWADTTLPVAKLLGRHHSVLTAQSPFFHKYLLMTQRCQALS